MKSQSKKLAKTPAKPLNFFIIVIVVIGVIILLGSIAIGAYLSFVQFQFSQAFKSAGITSFESCSFVFKTRADYSNLVSIALWKNPDDPENRNPKYNYSAQAPFFYKIEKLDDNYYTMDSWCWYYSPKWKIAYTSMALEEFQKETALCDRGTSGTWVPGTPSTVYCEGFDTNLLMNNIIDPDSVTELYVCKAASLGNLNVLISNKELATKCTVSVPAPQG